MRTVAVFHLGGVGGPSRSLTGALAWLAERGELHCLFPEEGAAAADYHELGEVAVVPYSALTYARRPRAVAATVAAFTRDVATFRRELRARRADLAIVVTSVLPAALVAARLERVPAIVYAAEVYSQPWKHSRALELWGAGLARATARLASGIVCCSRLVAEQYPAGRGALAVAYPPIRAEDGAGDREAGRARHGMEHADPVIAVVGALSRGRGQDLAIRALPAIRREAPAAHLLVVGAPHPRPVDLAYAEELRTLAAELGVGEAVTFAGAVDAIADVYSAADVVVNPARTAESFGRVAAEALVAGRPPVVTDVGAVREVLREGVDGILVPPERPDAIAAAVLELRRDPARARRLAETGAARVRSEFGPEQDLAAWRGVVAAVAGEGG